MPVKNVTRFPPTAFEAPSCSTPYERGLERATQRSKVGRGRVVPRGTLASGGGLDAPIRPSPGPVTGPGGVTHAPLPLPPTGVSTPQQRKTRAVLSPGTPIGATLGRDRSMHTPLTPGRPIGGTVGRAEATPMSRGLVPAGAPVGRTGATPVSRGLRAPGASGPGGNPSPSQRDGRAGGCAAGTPATQVTSAAPRWRGAASRTGTGCSCGGPCDCHPPSQAGSRPSSAKQTGGDLPTADTMYSTLGGHGFRKDWATPAAIEQWVALSDLSYAYGVTGRATGANAELARAAKADPGSPLSSVYQIWMLSHLNREWQFEEAAAFGERLLPHVPEIVVGGRPAWAYVYGAVADAYRSLGDLPRAAATLERWAGRARYRLGDRNPWLELGLIEATQGHRGRAKKALSQAIRSASDEAQRAAAAGYMRRLDLRVSWTQSDPESLAEQVMRALRSQDSAALGDLFSPTHFTLGVVASEAAPVNRRIVLEQLIADLRDSVVRGDAHALRGSGGKRYLVTRGWRGRVFRGLVWFVLVRRYDGWELGGLALTRVTPEAQALYRRLGSAGLDPLVEANIGPLPTPARPTAPPELRLPSRGGDGFPAGTVRPVGWVASGASAAVRSVWPETNRDVLVNQMDPRMELLAPWPAGDSFQAGGLGLFFGAGGILWIGDAQVVVGALLEDPFRFMAYSLLRECGLGAGGAYSQELWHVGDFDAYAIDFVSYERGSLIIDDGFNGMNRSKGVHILASSEGCTIDFRDSIPEGTDDGRGSNLVTQECFLHGQPTPYSLRYLHLDGPGKVFTNFFQFVRQGQILGYVDDTGESRWDHIHFEVHDRRVNGDWDADYGPLDDPIGSSVRMTIEGKWMTVDSDGRCITSSNTPLTPGIVYSPDPTPSAACPPELATCVTSSTTGYCADLDSDPRNCGMCGLNCGVDDRGRPGRCRFGRCVYDG